MNIGAFDRYGMKNFYKETDGFEKKGTATEKFTQVQQMWDDAKNVEEKEASQEQKNSSSVQEIWEYANAQGMDADSALLHRMKGETTAPYSYLATDGIIDYNGVVFVCDDKKNQLSLGDVSEPKNCLKIPLSKGGSLVVNKDHLTDLSNSIGMFSSEDVKRILAAIAQYNKIQRVQYEIEEDTNSIGDGTTNTANGGEEASKTITSTQPEKEDAALKEKESIKELFGSTAE